MIRRQLTACIPAIQAAYPVLVISGPRQSGKSTLARACFPDLPYVSLEDPTERATCLADPRAWLARLPDGAVIDEVQRCPELPSWLQGIVDADRRMGRWVLTGSQQYMLLDRVTQSLAGRAALLELMPFGHGELAETDKAHHDPASAVWHGGYPPLYDRPVEPARWFGDYLATYLERDVRSVLTVRDLNRFSAFVRLCATRIGQSVNLAAMAGELGIDGKTAGGWLSVLVAGYVVHLLPPHHANLGKRVVKHPKLYFIDTGLACRLLAIPDPVALPTHISWGALAENWIVTEVIKARRHRGWRTDTLYWWRSSDGLESDLILDQGGRLRSAEIKATTSPGPGDLAAQRRFAGLAGDSHAGSTLFHFGSDSGRLLDADLRPWQHVDAAVAAWGM